MRAIILAAGRGLRLQQPEDQQLPKCLLQFGDTSLLGRHLRLLRSAGIEDVILGLGFRHKLVEAELDRLNWRPRPQIVLNDRYELGSVLTVYRTRAAMTQGGEILLMDADVLYDDRIMSALVTGPEAVNRMLIDREFEPGDEPVKTCVRDGLVVEMRKTIPPDLAYDTIGESVGFFRFNEAGARCLAALIAEYVDTGRSNMPHEEAIRDLILERSQRIEVRDVTGMPWLEIDFIDDVTRAANEILPRLQTLPPYPSKVDSGCGAALATL